MVRKKALNGSLFRICYEQVNLEQSNLSCLDVRFEIGSPKLLKYGKRKTVEAG